MENQSILEIALAQGDRSFIPAFEALMGQISTLRSIAILGQMNAHAAALKAGDSFTPSVAVDACGMLALLHISIGAPLRLDDALLEAWGASDGSPWECESVDCRYRQPAGFKPLCCVCGARMREPGWHWAASTLPAADVDQLRLLASTVDTLAFQLSPDRARHIRLAVEKGVRAQLAGQPVPKSLTAGVALVIAHQHLTIRTPLFLSDELYDKWANNGEDTGCAECVDCGYRGMLEGDEACVLCGGVTGAPGVFSTARKRRASVAGIN